MSKIQNNRWIFVVVLIVFALLIAGCTDSATYAERTTVNQQQDIYLRNQPIPSFDWSLERDEAIQLYQIRNEARNTYTVITAQGTGTVLFMCPSIGYPLPADVQLTNPQQYYSGTTVSQAEPNGLFSSLNTDATWVMCVNEDGEVTPIYTEQKANAFPYAVQIVDGQIVPVDANNPWVTINVKK